MQELFFSKLRSIFFKSCVCTVISSDIIQVRAENLIGRHLHIKQILFHH